MLDKLRDISTQVATKATDAVDGIATSAIATAQPASA